MIHVATATGTTRMRVGPGLRGGLAALVGELAPQARQVAYVVDEQVDALWPEPTWAPGLEVVTVRLPAGEAAKTREVLAEAQDALLALRRDEPVVVRGGGAALDLGGFAAGTVRRGLSWIAVPTTVVAMADAALGGKTAINHARGKNLLGVFHPPAFVLADVDHLDTLPAREVRAGLAEVYKCARLGAPGLAAQLASGGPAGPAAWTEALEAAASLKARLVQADERDHGVRRRLNYGHTVGHALERLLGPLALRHGEAVALGMVAAARLAVGRGRLPPALERAQVADLERLGLPVRAPVPLDAAAVLEHLGEDKKRVSPRHTFVLPVASDDVEIVTDVTDAEVLAALEALRP